MCDSKLTNLIKDLCVLKEKFNSFDIEESELSELSYFDLKNYIDNLSDSLNSRFLTNLSNNLNNLLNEKRLEAYSDLTKAYNYPELNNIDFLNESEIIKLDTLLKKIGVDNYVLNLYSVNKSVLVHSLITSFLIEKKICENRYRVICPYCHESSISREMDLSSRVHLENLITDYLNESNPDRYDVLDEIENYMYFDCYSCDSYFDNDDKVFENLTFKEGLKLTKLRNKSLDNV